MPRSVAAAIVVTLSLPAVAGAQPLLDRLLIVAPAAPGGGWDQTARALQQVLQAEGIVRTVEVENVAGAAGTIGLAQFVDAHRGDGRALIVSGLVMLGAIAWNDSPVSLRQATPIARLTGEFEIVAVPAASPHRDLRSVADALRQRPEALVWGGGSAGGTDHILAGLIAEASGVSPRRVNYIAFSGGGEAVAALMGGNLTAGISGYSEFAPHIDSGRLRAIAISSPSRVSGMDVATLREQGLAIDLVNWRALLAAPEIPAEDRARLTTIVARAVRSASWQRQLANRGWTDMHLDGAAFESYLDDEQLRIGRIVARLRGPATGASTAAGAWIVPTAVLCGAALVAMMLAVRSVRSARSASPVNHTADSAAALLPMAAGLALFVVLLRPIGFIASATILFTVAASAFRDRTPMPPGGRTWLRNAAAGVLFSTAIYIAFTRGLDLSLPAGSLWPWMR